MISDIVTQQLKDSFVGPTFEVISREYPELLHKFVTVCDVFARMSPEQKQMVVNKLQEVEYTVAMCGDGANDCAALKVRAHCFCFIYI